MLDERAVCGEVLLSKQQKQKEIHILREQARTLGLELRRLGETLVTSPENVAFNGDAIQAEFVTKDRLFSAESLQVAPVLELTSSLRNALLEHRRLQQTLKDLGLD